MIYFKFFYSGNFTYSGRASVKSNKYLKYGLTKLSNIWSKHIRNYFMKIQKIWEDEKDEVIIEEQIKIIIDNIEIIVKLLNPVLQFYVNKMWRGYKVEGFATCKDEKYEIFYLYILLVINIKLLPFKIY